MLFAGHSCVNYFSSRASKDVSPVTGTKEAQSRSSSTPNCTITPPSHITPPTPPLTPVVRAAAKRSPEEATTTDSEQEAQQCPPSKPVFDSPVSPSNETTAPKITSKIASVFNASKINFAAIKFKANAVQAQVAEKAGKVANDSPTTEPLNPSILAKLSDFERDKRKANGSIENEYTGSLRNIFDSPMLLSSPKSEYDVTATMQQVPLDPEKEPSDVNDEHCAVQKQPAVTMEDKGNIFKNLFQIDFDSKVVLSRLEDSFRPTSMTSSSAPASATAGVLELPAVGGCRGGRGLRVEVSAGDTAASTGHGVAQKRVCACADNQPFSYLTPATSTTAFLVVHYVCIDTF